MSKLGIFYFRVYPVVQLAASAGLQVSKKCGLGSPAIIFVTSTTKNVKHKPCKYLKYQICPFRSHKALNDVVPSFLLRAHSTMWNWKFKTLFNTRQRCETIIEISRTSQKYLQPAKEPQTKRITTNWQKLFRPHSWISVSDRHNGIRMFWMERTASIRPKPAVLQLKHEKHTKILLEKLKLDGRDYYRI